MDILENIIMVKETEKINANIAMEISIMENGKKTKSMGKENIKTKMVIFMKENGNLDNN